MQATMQSQIIRDGNSLRVSVSGPVDIDTAPILRAHVQQAWTRTLNRLELDFTRVDYMSSPGIALLLEFRHWLARDNVAVLLTAASPRVREVLATCRLEAMFLPEDHGDTHVPVAG
jgi:anti-anti-sigma factor